MKQWFKRIIGIPTDFGISMANAALVKTVQMIFDLYAKRLLKIETDRIIESTERGPTYDTLYTKPLDLNELHQTIGSNNLIIHSTHLSSIQIRFPWHSFSDKYTTISIDHITMTMFLHRLDLDSIYKSLDLTSSYYLNPVEEDSLQEICSKIKSYLVKITRVFKLKISNIYCTLNESIEIVFANILYKNDELFIDKITIKTSDKNMKHVVIKHITYINNKLTINTIKVDSKICEYLPTYYTGTDSIMPDFQIYIDTLKIDDLCTTNIDIHVNNNIVSINKLTCIYPNLFTINTQDCINFNLDTSILTTPSIINIDILNLEKTMALTEYYRKCLNHISNSFVKHLEDEDDDKPIDMQILNLNLHCSTIFGTYCLSICNIRLIDVTYSLENVELKIPNHYITISKLTKWSDHICFDKISWCITDIISDDLDIYISDIKLRSDFSTMTYLDVDGATVDNMIQLYQAIVVIKTKIENCTTDNKSNHKLCVNFTNTNLYYTTDLYKFRLQISKLIIIKQDNNISINDTDDNDIQQNKSPIPTCTNFGLNLYVDNMKIIQFEGISWIDNVVHIKKTRCTITKILPSVIYNIISLFPTKKQIQLEPNAKIYDNINLMTSCYLDDIYELYGIDTADTEYMDNRDNRNNTIDSNDVIKNGPSVNYNDGIMPIIIEDYDSDTTNLDIQDSDKIGFKIMFDQIYLDIYDNTDVNILCVFAKNISLQKIDQQINICVQTGAIIDTLITDPEWKHIAKFSKYNSLNLKIEKVDDTYDLTFYIQNFTLKIRQNFIEDIKWWKQSNTNMNKSSSNIIPIRNIIFNELHCVLNYKPFSTFNLLNINNYEINLPKIKIIDVYTLDDIKRQMSSKWINKLNLNILDIISHVNIISPYTPTLRKLSNLIVDFTK